MDGVSESLRLRQVGLVDELILENLPPRLLNSHKGSYGWMLVTGSEVGMSGAVRLCGEAGYLRARGYEPVTLYVPGLKERGEYYTFLKDRERIWP